MNVSILQYTLAPKKSGIQLKEKRENFMTSAIDSSRRSPTNCAIRFRQFCSVPTAQGFKTLRPANDTAIERIERQARHQAILIDDLLDISRFRYGKLQLKREISTCVSLYSMPMETLQNDYGAKRMKLEVNFLREPYSHPRMKRGSRRYSLTCSATR